MTSDQQSLETLRTLARSFCDAVEQSDALPAVEFMQRLNQSLPQLYPLGRALPLTDPPPEDPDEDDLLSQPYDVQASILAARDDAAMQGYLAHYHRGQRILESKLGAVSIPNMAPPTSQAARERIVSKEALVDLLAVAYAGLRDLFDLEADKDGDARIYYWRTQLTGAWAQTQLLPAALALQTYLDALP